jgi:hypothetical protein
MALVAFSGWHWLASAIGWGIPSRTISEKERALSSSFEDGLLREFDHPVLPGF